MSTFKCLVLSLVTNRTLTQSELITTVDTQELLSALYHLEYCISTRLCCQTLYKLSGITDVIIVYSTDSVNIIFIEKAFLKFFIFLIFWDL